MSRKWSVRKRDGAWGVFDGAGKLRYATDNHFMALSFALMKGERKKQFRIVPPMDMGFGDVLRHILDHPRPDEEEDE